MPQVIALNFTCLCKGEVITPVPLLPAKSLITVMGCGPACRSGSEERQQGLWCRLSGQAIWPYLCTPSPFSTAVGLWGPTVSNHPHRGVLRYPWASSPAKMAKALPPGLYLEPPAQERAVFSVSEQRTVSKASKLNNL